MCLGLCLDGLLTCLHVGSHLADQGVLLFGKWPLFVSSGAFGGKETIEVLKTWKEPWKTLSLFYHSLYCWTSAYVQPLFISFFDLLSRFSISS